MLTEKGITHPVVVKLGGSIVTRKDTPYTPNKEAIDKLAEILSGYYRNNGQLILVHGGGSYGHYAVEEARRRKGVLDVVDVAQVQKRMLELSVIIASSLIEHGLPISIHPAHTLCKNENDCCFDVIIEDLSNGLVPMTYGDIIATDKGYKIISGDDLTLWLASTTGSRRILFVMDQPGVLDKTGKVMEKVTPHTLGEVGSIMKKEIVDVTGGIAKKLESALEFVVDHDVEVRIVDIDGLKEILSGGKAGTIITK